MDEKLNKSKRLMCFDIAKGIGIILVVWSHAGGPLSQQINQFHMPLFFLISGFLYKNSSNLKDYIKRKIKTLYLPFVITNLLFLLIHIIQSGLEGNNYLYFLKRFFLIVTTLDKDGKFLGATWFLGSLFLVSVVYKIIDYYFTECTYKYHVITLLFIAFAIVAFRIKFPYKLSRTIILGMFYAVGYWSKVNFSKIKGINTISVALLCVLMFFSLTKYNYTYMGENRYNHVELFIIGAFCAAFFVLFISRKLEKCSGYYADVVKKSLSYLGRNSLDIVIWHFVFFRVVIAIQLLYHSIPLSELLKYYPTYKEPGLWWMLYLIVGISFSIIFGKIYKNIWKYFKKSLIKKQEA